MRRLNGVTVRLHPTANVGGMEVKNIRPVHGTSSWINNKSRIKNTARMTGGNGFRPRAAGRQASRIGVSFGPFGYQFASGQIHKKHPATDVNRLQL
jgi:hypothetical protein